MRISGGRRWLAPLLASTLVLTLGASLAGCAWLGGGSTSGTALPCNGSVISGAATPDITLRNADADQETPAPVGAVVEIRMDGQHTWNLDTVTPGDVLTPVGAQGVFQQGECVWDFLVANPGVTTVQMVGGALCAPNQPCPAYAIVAKFIIRSA
jgi:hypothetical protein